MYSGPWQQVDRRQTQKRSQSKAATNQRKDGLNSIQQITWLRGRIRSPNVNQIIFFPCSCNCCNISLCRGKKVWMKSASCCAVFSHRVYFFHLAKNTEASPDLSSQLTSCFPPVHSLLSLAIVFIKGEIAHKIPLYIYRKLYVRVCICL